MNTKHWKNEIRKILGYTSDEEVQTFLRESKKTIAKKSARGGITPMIVAIAVVSAHRKALQTSISDEKKVYRSIRHVCLRKYWKKFRELIEDGWGSRRIAKYFEKMGCRVTHTTVAKYARMLREIRDREEE